MSVKFLHEFFISLARRYPSADARSQRFHAPEHRVTPAPQSSARGRLRLRSAPSYPSMLLESQQGCINCAFVQLQHFLAELFDAAGDAKTVKGPQAVKGFQDH